MGHSGKGKRKIAGEGKGMKHEGKGKRRIKGNEAFRERVR